MSPVTLPGVVAPQLAADLAALAAPRRFRAAGSVVLQGQWRRPGSAGSFLTICFIENEWFWVKISFEPSIFRVWAVPKIKCVLKACTFSIK